MIEWVTFKMSLHRSSYERKKHLKYGTLFLFMVQL